MKFYLKKVENRYKGGKEVIVLSNTQWKMNKIGERTMKVDSRKRKNDVYLPSTYSIIF